MTALSPGDRFTAPRRYRGNATAASPKCSSATQTVSPGSIQRVSTMLLVSTTSPAARGRSVAAA